MSLFQTKDLWSLKIQNSEEFDEKHLNICNIDNN
jgi:hypothetical protein